LVDSLTVGPNLFFAIVVGYLVGAVPIADRLSRWNGVDIFAVGTALAGASNVRRNVGKVPGLVVLVGDLGKGVLAVLASDWIGVEGPWLLLPVAAAVAGHWRSVFSGFRGGDGMATLGGSTIALFPSIGMISVGVAMVVALGGQRMPYSSLLGIVTGYGTLVALSLTYDQGPVLAVGVGGLASLVLAYAINGHRRRRHSEDWDALGESDGFAERSG